MILSYSFIRDYQNCPRKAHHKYVLRDLPKEDSAALRHGNLVHKMLEDAINENKPLSENYKRYVSALRSLQSPVKAEVKLASDPNGSPCDFFAAEAAFRGKVDVLVSNDREAVLVDWKTGKVREDPLELEIQACLTKINYSQLKIISGYYVWLAEARIGKKFIFKENEQTFRWLSKLRKEIMGLEEWKPMPNPLCGWCQLLSCEFNRRGK
jgi:CRISPR/Cas system-associated exonuclease Cas4 (RecB family)